MTSRQEIKTAQDRVISAFTKKPSLGKSTDKQTIRLDEGLVCTACDGDTEYTIDMPTIMGGSGTAPSPGFYGRAALGSCIAMGIKMAAARNEIDINSIVVDIEMDWDDRGIFGLDNVSAGCRKVRIVITVDSPDNPLAVQVAVDEGLANDPWLLVFAEPQNMDTRVSIRSTAQKSEVDNGS